MSRLNIITPLTRGENLLALGSSIRKAIELNNYNLPVKWWIIIDPNCPPLEYTLDFFSIFPWANMIVANNQAPAGHKHRNYVLDILEKNYPDEYFYSLDDDNLLYESFINIVEANLEYSGIIGNQLLKGDILRLKADPNNIRLNHIDTAQFAFKTKLLNGLRFDETRYDADGVFIEKLYADNKDSFIVLDQPICYYNYLR